MYELRCVGLASALREFLQRADGFTWFGTYGVIRAHIGATNHALLVNDISCGHALCNFSRIEDIVQIYRTLQTEVGPQAPNCARACP